MPILLGIGAALLALGKWILELVHLYGRKLVFFVVLVGMFYSTLYVVATAVFQILRNNMMMIGQ